MLVLITYDVSTQDAAGKSRLRKVAKECVNYGQRVQNSVFECILDSSQLLLLKDRLVSLINEKEVHELPLWEKYLIYATAFGISEKVIKAIKIHAKEFNIDSSPILNHHCYIHSANFHRTARSFGRSIHTSSRGGGFGGHGYGGGGRGGGGGGGGH